MYKAPTVGLSDRFVKREEDADMPRQPSDDELLAWAEALAKATPRPRRRKPLVAKPLNQP